MKHILVNVPSYSLREFENQVKEWYRIHKLNCKVRRTGSSIIFETDNVVCRFIPSYLYDEKPHNYRGLRFDEVFGFMDEDAAYFRVHRDDEVYRGTWLNYIREMNDIRVENTPYYDNKNLI